MEHVFAAVSNAAAGRSAATADSASTVTSSSADAFAFASNADEPSVAAEGEQQQQSCSSPFIDSIVGVTSSFYSDALHSIAPSSSVAAHASPFIAAQQPADKPSHDNDDDKPSADIDAKLAPDERAIAPICQ
jgi:hypothetical protein